VLSGVSKIVIVLTEVKLLITFIIQQESSAVTDLIEIKIITIPSNNQRE